MLGDEVADQGATLIEVELVGQRQENLARLQRDNQDESRATIKMREPFPVSSRREGVARPQARDGKTSG
jgi:hypothetical protein